MNYFVSVVCGVFVLGGLGVAGYGIRIIHQARESASWVPTDGQITHSQMVSNSGGEGTTYAPEVHYTYQVEGKEYNGTRIFIGDNRYSSNGDYARNYIERYPVGKEVSVYFDPQQPGSAILEPGTSKKSYFPLALGLGFAAFGGWFYLIFWLKEV